jgi:hypothetical protein
MIKIQNKLIRQSPNCKCRLEPLIDLTYDIEFDGPLMEDYSIGYKIKGKSRY